MLLLKVQSDNINHKIKFSHTLCEIWIIPKLCLPLSPFASKSGGHVPPSSYGSAVHAHILSFYEWKIVQQLLGDNSDVTCVSIGKSTCNIFMKIYDIRAFSFTR